MKLDGWDQRYLDLAYHVGNWSKDPSTKVGAVVVRPDRTIASLGYNGLPRRVADTDERLSQRTIKYAMVVHAEPNAIVAAREPLHGCTIYTSPFPPCSSCAALIIQAGIERVVAPTATVEQRTRWGDSFRLMEEMFHEAAIDLVLT